MSEPLRVLVCGTGNSAHVLAGLASARSGVEVRVLTLRPEKAERWTAILARERLRVTRREGGENRLLSASGPRLVSSEPAEAVPGCDVVILAVPAFGHEAYLRTLAPRLEPGALLVGLPGQNGFEFAVRDILGAALDRVTLLNFESLPWICRQVEFGRHVSIYATKVALVGSMRAGSVPPRVEDPGAALQRLVGRPPRMSIAGHPLGITLLSPNAYSHPPIMYARWRDWDGEPQAEPEPFYQGIGRRDAELLAAVSDEVVAVARAIMAERPQADLTQVIPMHAWDLSRYGDDIADPTDLRSALATNRGYDGMMHPMLETADGRWVPDFSHRYLAEDIPFGLAPIRGIAEIAGVETPEIDRVLRWGQAKLGREYLAGSKMAGRDLDGTRCPQRYGLATLSDILDTG